MFPRIKLCQPLGTQAQDRGKQWYSLGQNFHYETEAWESLVRHTIIHKPGEKRGWDAVTVQPTCITDMGVSFRIFTEALCATQQQQQNGGATVQLGHFRCALLCYSPMLQTNNIYGKKTQKTKVVWVSEWMHIVDRWYGRQKNRGRLAQLVRSQPKMAGAVPKLVWFSVAAKDFFPGVNFQCRLLWCLYNPHQSHTSAPTCR